MRDDKMGDFANSFVFFLSKPEVIDLLYLFEDLWLTINFSTGYRIKIPELRYSWGWYPFCTFPQTAI
jgi:hypothetical protein